MKKSKMSKVMAVLNSFAAKELGYVNPKLKRSKRQPSAFADIKKYRREHPESSLREAAIACGRNVK